VQQLGRRRSPEQFERTVRADVLGRVEPDQVVQQVVTGVVEVDVVVRDAEVGVERDPDEPAVAGVLGSRSANGVGSSSPFFTILIFPLRSRMKIRPSGAISKPVGPFRPSPTTSDVWKSGGGAATAPDGPNVKSARILTRHVGERRRSPPAPAREPAW
jgi:hypothetical protein